MKTLFNKLTLSSFNPNAFFIWNRYSFLTSHSYCNSLHDATIYNGASAQIVHYFKNAYPLAHNHWVGILRISKKDGGFDQFFISVAADEDTALNNIQTLALEGLIRCGYLNNRTNKIDFLTDDLISHSYNNDRMSDFMDNYCNLEEYKP